MEDIAMKSNQVRNKSAVASLVGLTALTVGSLFMLGASKLAEETEPTVSVTEETSATENITPKTINPFTKPMAFERITPNAQGTALLEIKIEPDAQYRIKELISGEILSRGVWQFDDTTSTITLTHVGDYPMINVFKVDPYLTDAASDTQGTQWQLTFVLSESTNLRYEILADGDVFTQKLTDAENPSVSDSQEGVM